MLPSRQTEDQIKKFKTYTGLTPNFSDSLAFYRSVESGLRYSQEQNTKNKRKINFG